MERFSYLNRDSRTLRSELIAMIPHLTDSWTDYHQSDPGIVLLDLLVYVADKLSFYTDRMAMESLFVTASERENVFSGLKLVGYSMRGYYSAVTSVGLRSDHSHEIYVKKYDIFSTEEEDGVVFKFVATEDVVVPPALMSITHVPLMEGTKVTYEYGISNVDGRGRIRVPNPRLAENSLELYINGELWEKVDEVYFQDSLQPVFGVEYDREGIPYVKLIKNWEDLFADPNEVSIEIIGLESSGSKANIGRGTITRIVSDLSDSLGETECVKYINDIIHVDTVTGGAEPETVEEAKKKAPRRLRTMWTAVTLRDYEDLCETYPGISRALAIDWSVKGTYITDPYHLDIILVPDGGGTVSTIMKDNIYHHLMERRMTPLKFQIIDPDYVTSNIEVRVQVRTGYPNKASLSIIVREAITSYFSSENRDFGEVIRPVSLRNHLESTIDDILTVEVVQPSTNIVLGINQFIKAGTISVIVEEV